MSDVGKTEQIHPKQNEMGPFPYTMCKTKLNKKTNLQNKLQTNVRPGTIKILDENIESNLFDLSGIKKENNGTTSN